MKKISNSKILSVLGSLLLAIFLSIAGIMLSVRLGFASDVLIMKSMDKVNYYHMVYEDFKSQCDSLAIPHGLQPEVFDGVFTEEQITYDGKRYLKAELTSTVFELDTDIYKQKLCDNIYDYIEKNELSSEGDVDEVISEFADDIIKYYIDIIRMPYASKIGVLFRIIDQYFNFIFLFMVLLSLLVVGIIIKLNLKLKHRIFRYLAYSTMSGAISVSAIPLYCVISEFYKRLQIYPEYMYKLIVAYIEKGLNVMLAVGCTFFVLSIIMIIISTSMRRKLIRGSKR